MGTESLWVPAVIAALGTGAQYVNQKNAASREDAGQAQAIRDQEQLQQQAAGRASTLTKQIARDNPNQIQAQATGDYVKQLRQNAAGASQPGASSALAPAVGASKRYSSDVGNSQEQVGSYGNNMANEMGAIDAAVRQRQNEGLAQQTLGTDLNTLGAQSYTKNFVDQLRAKSAGVANPWVSLLGQMAQNYGTSKGAGTAFAKTGGGGAALLGDGTVGSVTRTMPAAPNYLASAFSP